MRHRVLIFTLLCTPLLLAVPLCGLASANLTSSKELGIIIRQAEATYLRPMGMDLNGALNKAPRFVATAMGLTLQRQEKYLHQHGEYEARFNVLTKQAVTFLKELAKAHKYRDPETGGQLTDTIMEFELYSAINGEANGFFVEHFGLNPANAKLPMMLAQVPEPLAPEPTGKLHQKNDPNAIVLLGQEAPRVEGKNTNLKGNNVPPEDVMLGTWYSSSNPSLRITFTRKKNAYEASQSEMRSRFKDKYRVTTVYTFSASGSRVTNSLFGTYRNFNAKREYVCQPMYNDYDCNNPVTETTIPVGMMPKKRYYFIMSNDRGILSGWRKNY